MRSAIEIHRNLDSSAGCSFSSKGEFPLDIHSQIRSSHLIDPSDVWKATWDTSVLILVIVSMLWLPFTFSFNTPFDTSLNFFEVSVCGIFLIDIGITFHTAVHVAERGIYLLNHRDIALHYLQGYFFVDLISSIPIDIIIGYIVYNIDLSVLKLIRLVRFIRLSKIIKVLRKYELNRYQTAALVRKEYAEVFYMLLIGNRCNCWLVSYYWLLLVVSWNTSIAG